MSEKRRRCLNYIKGWRTGASFATIDKALEHDTDFNKGWRDGRDAAACATEYAEIEYGYKLARITLADKKGLQDES